MTHFPTKTFACALLLVAAAAPPTLAQSPAAMQSPVPEPPMALALEAAQTALQACQAKGYRQVAVSIVNAAGELKLMMSADGTPPGHAVPHSLGKAMAELTYGIPSALLQKQAQSDNALAAHLAATPTLLARAGGEPLRSKGQLIGAIGISGAPGAEKDEQCTMAALDRIRNRL